MLILVEPAMGIEPITYHLQGGCSTFELRRHACQVFRTHIQGFDMNDLSYLP